MEEHSLKFLDNVGTRRVVLGISGGKDSTVVAAAFAKIVGPENVYGVMMPCGVQHDIADSKRAIALTSINSMEVNIGEAFKDLLGKVVHEVKSNTTARDFTSTKVNMLPRLRMAVLYGVAQAVNGIVLNICNRSERILGYATLFSDFAGSYSPFQDLTVSEVIALGKWLKLPADLVEKTPADGLQESTDEDRLGIKYAAADRLIRFDDGDDADRALLCKKHAANKFKLDMLHIAGPDYGYPDFFK